MTYSTTSHKQPGGQQEQQHQHQHQHQQGQQGEDETTALKAADVAVVVDPLAGLTESDRLSLLIRFGAAASGGMCAAMSHGHSFQSSIFRLPAKCSGCHELVWGPFTRGCTCLTCSVTVHRSCTGLASMPPCPRKDVFDAFCRSELGLPPLVRREVDNAEAATTAAGLASASTGDGDRKEACSSAGATTIGDLDEWATVEGTSAHSTSAATTTTTTGGVRSSPLPQAQEQPPASASCAVQDLGSSFFWSPLGFGERKRPLSADTNGEQQSQQQEQQQGERQPVEAHELADDAADAVGCPSTVATAPAGQENGETVSIAQLAAATGGVASTAAGSNGTIGIGGVTKLSVAGGVVGALFGGPMGAVVGLNFGAVLGAGRSVQQGLWQRIEKNRRAAGAEGIGLRKAAGGTAGAAAEAEAAAAAAATTALGVEEGEEAARESRDVWARIAKEVEGAHQPIVWELDPKQEKLLEQGECDAGEVAMFVVGKVLADETAMLYHLHAALLAEFRSRHRSCGSPRRSRPGSIRRRSSDTDMVALFPRSSGRRSAAAAAATATATGAATPDVDSSNKGSRFNRLDSSSAQQDGGFFASTPGLEKTYSFVEEAEMVAGEGSDTPSFDEDGPGAVSGGVEGTNGRRNDGRLSGARASECSSCGGRLTSGASQSGRHTRALTRDVDEDEGGLGDGWAEAEAPLCWCRDEAGFSASPEDERNSTLAVAAARRNGGTSRNVDAAEPPPGVNGGGSLEEAFSGAGRDRSHGDETDQLRSDKRSAEAEAIAGVAGDERTSGGREAVEETRDPLRDVHGVLRELTRAVLGWCPLLTASHEAQIQAVNCIDQRVFSQTYGPVFERIAASGPAREGDTLLARRTRREERSRAANGRPTLLSTCRAEAVSALRAAGSARTGRDKLGFLVQAVERISDALPDQRTTDALIFSVCRHLAATTTSAVDGAGLGANGEAVQEGQGDDGVGRRVEEPALARPHAEVAFVEQFMRDESWVMGKEGYVLTTVIAALHVLNDPDMSDDVFLDAPPQPPTAANSEDSGVEGGDDASEEGGAEIIGADYGGVSDDVHRE